MNTLVSDYQLVTDSLKASEDTLIQALVPGAERTWSWRNELIRAPDYGGSYW